MRNPGTYRVISAPILAVLALLFFGATTITAAPGDLDPTFGNGGIVITNRHNSNGNGNNLYAAHAMAIQPDGKIVVVGEGFTSPSDSWDFAVVRYNPDGSLDNSFGGGIVNTPVGNSQDIAHSVAIQTDGKIVVAGSTCSGVGTFGCTGFSFAVVRYNPDGSLDTSFNGTGIVSTAAGNSDSGASDLAIQTDGKIVVAGISGNFHAGISGNGNFAIVRYNPNGSLDTSFNSSGKAITPVGYASSLAIQADGKIVVAGSNGNGILDSSFVIVRYNPNGSLDTSFNGTGIVITGNSDGGASDLAIQTDGKIVVAGDSLAAAGNWRTADFAIVRYKPDGSLDTSFGGTGKIIIPDSDSVDSARSVAIQPNGKIVVAGDSSNIGSDFTVEGSDFALVRLNPNGSLDTSFNDTGTVITSVGNAWDTASSVAIQTDGKIVVAGDTGPDDFKYFAVVRYQGDGATPASCPNPIDCNEFFVRQQYRDFLNREPDAPGLAHWAGEITACDDAPLGESRVLCIELKRTDISAAFFLSPEFQYTGYFVYRLYKGSLIQNGAGRFPTYQEFLRDVRQVANGIIQNNQLSAATIEANKKNFTEEFTRRAEFRSLYDPLSNFDYVERLFQITGITVSAAEKQALVNGLNNQTETRASVLQKVVDGAVVMAEGNQQFTTAYGRAFYEKEFNSAFVLMEYFGYLRRDPDAAGYQHWLDKLNLYGNYVDAEMVLSFIYSPEYRARFGQP